jgi:hypothetical protein
VEYVRTLVEHPDEAVRGAEAHQPPVYYVLASVPWRLAPAESALFWTRLLSGLAGTLTLALTWRIARRVWPQQPVVALTAAIATLAPGHLSLLASVNNDPLAAALCSLATLAAVEVWLSAGRSRSWWLGYVLAGIAAVAVKVTAAPVVLAVALALAWHWRRVLWRRAWVRAAAGAALLGGVAANVVLRQRSPMGGVLAATAHFWPQALGLGPLAYVRAGGMAETFRTWWYAYDYLTRWPIALEAVLAIGTAAFVLAAVGGLVSALGGRRRPESGRTAVADTHTSDTVSNARVLAKEGAPGGGALVLWLAAVTQAAAVVARFGLGSYLQIEMGGAAQAKAFVFAVAPMAALFAWGLTRTVRRFSIGDWWIALGLFGWLVLLDALSLAFTTWQHYRWWQVGA